MKNNWTISTEQPVKYDIIKSTDIFDLDNTDLLSYCPKNSRRLIVIDLKVSNIYLKKILTYFNYHKIDYKIVIINAIEKEKNLDNLIYLLTQIEQFNVNRRNEPIVAIGGGVLLDIVGLASNLYRRGVPYIRIPTTLIGLVDACIGSKTSVNFMDRRNRIGSYYPPLISFLDKTFLKTLEPIEISSGLGEMLKMGVIKDNKLFTLLEKYGEVLFTSKLNGCQKEDEVINLSIEGMKKDLENNLWERNLKRSVDFGHSFSPILEIRSLTDNKVESLTHGQAVALDVIFSSMIAYHRKLLTKKDVKRIINTAKIIRLPVLHPYFLNYSYLLEALHDTEKHRNGDQNLPIPNKIGGCIFLNDVTIDEIKKAIETMKEWCKKDE